MAVNIAGNVQNMKSVQDCTGFIFCTFHVLDCTCFIFCTFHALDCTGFISCTFHALDCTCFIFVHLTLKIAQVSYFVHFLR